MGIRASLIELAAGFEDLPKRVRASRKKACHEVSLDVLVSARLLHPRGSNPARDRLGADDRDAAHERLPE
jgi:hypothetical protein